MVLTSNVNIQKIVSYNVTEPFMCCVNFLSVQMWMSVGHRHVLQPSSVPTPLVHSPAHVYLATPSLNQCAQVRNKQQQQFFKTPFCSVTDSGSVNILTIKEKMYHVNNLLVL